MSGTADITVLATGGTIDKVYTLAGELEIGPPAAQRLLEVLRTELRIVVHSVIGKDSLDITDDDRQALADAVDQLDTSSVVITHGTDTLSDTAVYLSRHRPEASRTVVLTGSLQPAAMTVSDAALNLGAALMASQTLAPGVYVCMGGRAFSAGQVRKDALTGQFVSTSPAGVPRPAGPGSPPPTKAPPG
ncbi:asparaginase domain-containing protein [Blastococcus brunescens]|uniref:Asparaginase domain-containing protein n=1 Tax=Blastococcus brunescens TaxID=1564165 RepID=A0ABZ1B270_9ACTN|nr:asparaginase domain-containing protein [Blastococcus sp. BMG 8361]WRL63963.1 asparaginase domain-containing protein [Blastococcus sp. BMG 8361]